MEDMEFMEFFMTRVLVHWFFYHEGQKFKKVSVSRSFSTFPSSW
jgi:hypothetical protein